MATVVLCVVRRDHVSCVACWVLYGMWLSCSVIVFLSGCVAWCGVECVGVVVVMGRRRRAEGGRVGGGWWWSGRGGVCGVVVGGGGGEGWEGGKGRDLRTSGIDNISLSGASILLLGTLF